MHSFSTEMSTVLQVASLIAAALLVVGVGVIAALVWAFVREASRSSFLAAPGAPRDDELVQLPPAGQAELDQADHAGVHAPARPRRCAWCGSRRYDGRRCVGCDRVQGDLLIDQQPVPRQDAPGAARSSEEASQLNRRAARVPCAFCARVREKLRGLGKVAAATRRGLRPGRVDSAR